MKKCKSCGKQLTELGTTVCRPCVQEAVKKVRDGNK